MTNENILFTDGGCLNNDQHDVSKRRMIAVVSDRTGAVLVERWQNGGSNNIAELWAVNEALKRAKDHEWNAVEVRTDSRNNFAWSAGRIGKKLNDRRAVTGPLRDDHPAAAAGSIGSGLGSKG
jgi:ribonuclease HI